ncbi:MAG: beta-galactosidase [Clostridia bacterium]|nr:beta-galactosidase [Clostridia bacterium]
MLPRNEYPRPQFERRDWLNLNGTWQFEIDAGDSGRERGILDKETLDGEILVPFCPESKLSGVEHLDFMKAVWYKRTFKLPRQAEGKRVFVNFGAVDYAAEIWVNGISCGTHRGGYSSFQIEITKAVKAGENVIAVNARDDQLGRRQPFGKQCASYNSKGCSYTRTTGIWQTVWLEWTSEERIRDVRLTPDGINDTLSIEAALEGELKGCTLKAEAFYEGEYETEAELDADGGRVNLMLLFEDPKLWNPGEPRLYELRLSLLKDGVALDRVKSYFGLRTVSFDGKKCLINGKPVFQRLILDQGFYPDGVYTAPTDDELKNDILRSMAMGFNGARLHQKVFEQRFLYWADKLGYIVWGEMPSWGIDAKDASTPEVFISEWLEVLHRDYNSPAIVGWCPWNEVWGESADGARDATLRLSYLVTKAFDRTRPCIDASGGIHALTDIFDVHDYEQQPAVFGERYAPGKEIPNFFPRAQKYEGQPVFVSEYGGIRWNPDGQGWGYGEGPKTEEEFIARYKGLTDALLDNPDHMGFCYTQLTDVEQERNGLYYYDRAPKFDPNVICAITSRKAAIEE